MSITKHEHSKPIVVCDMDGVVGDFVFSLTRVLKKLVGKPDYPYSTFQAATWGVDWLGLTKADEDLFWDYVRNCDDNFWANEREIIPGIVRKFYRASREKTWYWCTTRDDCHTGTAQKQSVSFLEKHGFNKPNVVVSDKKGDFCYAVQADFFLDDKFANCKQVREKSPTTRVFFLMLPSQQEFEVEAREMGMDVVKGAEAFIEYLHELYPTVEHHVECSDSD
jgi:hypothetical protein